MSNNAPLDARPPPAYEGDGDLAADDAAAEADSAALKGAGGAALLGGIAGAILMGPLTAVALAGAGAAAAAGIIGNKDTEKLAQATGQATINVGKAGVRKAKEVDSKYHVADKVKAGINTAAKRASELNEKHHITDKLAAGVSKAAQKVNDMTSAPPRPPPPSS